MKAIIVSCSRHYEIREKYIYKYFTMQKIDTCLVYPDFDHISKCIKKEQYENEIQIKVRKYKKNVSIGRIISYIEFSLKSKRIMEKYKPDIIYAIIPPNYLCKAINDYKHNNPNVKVIFDLYDIWPESFPINMLKKITPWKQLRTNNLECANAIILECDHYKRFIPKEYESITSVIYLAREKYKDIGITFNDECLNFLYVGSINRIIDIESIIQLLKTIKAQKNTHLHVVGDGQEKEKLFRLLNNEQIPYTYYGIVYDEDSKDNIYSRCQFAINMYVDNVEIGLTMKSIDYFSVGLPIINSNIRDTTELVSKYNIGYNIIGNKIHETAKKLLQCDRNQWEMMHKNVKEIMNKFFSEDSTIEKVDEICKEAKILNV